MDKLEIRLTKQQLDMIIYSLAKARDDALSAEHKERFATLRNWLFFRRVKRWGDEVADRVNELINKPVGR